MQCLFKRYIMLLLIGAFLFLSFNRLAVKREINKLSAELERKGRTSERADNVSEPSRRRYGYGDVLDSLNGYSGIDIVRIGGNEEAGRSISVEAEFNGSIGEAEAVLKKISSRENFKGINKLVYTSGKEGIGTIRLWLEFIRDN